MAFESVLVSIGDAGKASHINNLAGNTEINFETAVLVFSYRPESELLLNAGAGWVTLNTGGNLYGLHFRILTDRYPEKRFFWRVCVRVPNVAASIRLYNASDAGAESASVQTIPIATSYDSIILPSSLANCFALTDNKVYYPEVNPNATQNLKIAAVELFAVGVLS